MRKPPEKHCSAQTELVACAYLLGEGYDVFSSNGSQWVPGLIVQMRRRIGLSEPRP
jgi:hypothetical protein